MEEFQLRIYSILGMLPTGETISYGELAQQAGYKGYARQVGQLLKHLPKDSSLPWFRVINSKQEISFPIDSDAYLRQKNHLENEGWRVIGKKVKPS
ncbi:MGMT family protein [Marinomonas sp. 15G1-11]|uniref:MGMT family protein n=1 Tax=Marinomonas phaeophyticola TaxID=3004091 RepID=A0ABT4JPR4_9GAMM|nr:MGMT family protein [Marinomonas sp. 15G1-11]MCZ2720352.1 MGMT family protein [Marinomonas sp. 15G1-11]